MGRFPQPSLAINFTNDVKKNDGLGLKSGPVIAQPSTSPKSSGLMRRTI
jgi:hypothetical protein